MEFGLLDISWMDKDLCYYAVTLCGSQQLCCESLNYVMSQSKVLIIWKYHHIVPLLFYKECSLKELLIAIHNIVESKVILATSAENN